MLKAMDVARYFLSKDSQRTLFDMTLVEKNGRRFYQGNARLNKYLHMAQNLYIAKTGEKLFEEDLYAYDNGAVVTDVQENYSLLYRSKQQITLPGGISDFLDRIYKAFQSADLNELIEISHEDSEWLKKHTGYAKKDQKMDSLSHADEYREQYKDMLKVMDRMTL